MAKPIVPLTVTKINSLKAKEKKRKEKDYKAFAGGGLYLQTAKTCGKR